MYSTIIQDLWQLNEPPYYGFISRMNRNTGKWEDMPIPHDHPTPLLLEQEEGMDMFFSPLVYESPRRLNTNHKVAPLLFADLDPVHPETLEYRPHLAWETSPGSYQCVWLLDRPVKYRTEWASINRRMTYHVGADRGGWSGSKVLRIPGSVNYKRGGVTGKLLWDELGAFGPYIVAELDNLLPDKVAFNGEVGDAPEILTDRKSLDAIWKNLPSRIQWVLTRKAVKDRSRFIVNVAHQSKEAGVPKFDAYQMLWYAPYNKWRQRNNPQRLWHEVCAVYDD